MKKIIWAAAFLTGLALAQNAPAATITVANFNDSGAGSLRADLAAAASGDTIIVPAGNYII